MRLPNFTTAMVLTIAACLGTLQRADAQGPMQDSMQATDVDAGFGVENNGGHHKFPCTQIDLVCDHIVVDSITCRPHNMAGIAAVFSKTNRCPKKECQKITRVKYVQMDEPCYKRPTECPSFVPSDNFDADPASDDGSEDNTDDIDDTDDYDDDNSDADMNDAGLDAESLQLQKRNNDGHKKHHRNRHHHHKKPHPHRKHKHYHKKMKHPWAGLCVAKGEFCGANLFGCDFISKAAYVCDKVGAKPRFRTFCRRACRDGTCIGEPVTTVSASPSPSASASASVSASASASASPSPTTPVDPCKLLADTLLGLVETLLNILDAVANLLPGVLQTVVKQLIADLRDFLTVAVNDIAELAATIVSLEPVVKVLRDVSKDIATALNLPTGFLDPLLAALDGIITAAGSVIDCEGVPKDCRGLLTIVGSLLKSGLTLLDNLIDDTLGPILGAPIKIVLGQISALVDDLIQGLPTAVAAIQLLLAPLSLAINAIPGLPDVLTLPFKILIDLVNALTDC
ncbi:hypothetical protein BG011_005328 [Mortierella polycephala]|uniref:Uncharacterized protein n=1 Tax=Mortierella polycephala TaxID=41804 RepID=A0A9P6PZ04_9FUNG|nr:hypothetical protein BG011_005328 [Mortierella polycephala]